MSYLNWREVGKKSLTSTSEENYLILCAKVQGMKKGSDQVMVGIQNRKPVCICANHFWKNFTQFHWNRVCIVLPNPLHLPQHLYISWYPFLCPALSLVALTSTCPLVILEILAHSLVLLMWFPSMAVYLNL